MQPRGTLLLPKVGLWSDGLGQRVEQELSLWGEVEWGWLGAKSPVGMDFLRKVFLKTLSLAFEGGISSCPSGTS